MTKRCSNCNQIKNIEMFGKNVKSKDGIKTQCRDCETLKSKEWRSSNKEKSNIISKRYYNDHKDTIADRNRERYLTNDGKETSRLKAIEKKFNITGYEYDLLLKSQNGECKICGIHESKTKRKLAIDHNHITGNVRGLLCDKCNMGLGLFKDSQEILLRAIQYCDGVI